MTEGNGKRDPLGAWVKVAVLLAPIIGACIWGLTTVNKLSAEVAVLKDQVRMVRSDNYELRQVVGKVSVNQNRLMGALGVKPVETVPLRMPNFEEE